MKKSTLILLATLLVSACVKDKVLKEPMKNLRKNFKSETKKHRIFDDDDQAKNRTKALEKLQDKIDDVLKVIAKPPCDIEDRFKSDNVKKAVKDAQKCTRPLLAFDKKVMAEIESLRDFVREQHSAISFINDVYLRTNDPDMMPVVPVPVILSEKQRIEVSMMFGLTAVKNAYYAYREQLRVLAIRLMNSEYRVNDETDTLFKALLTRVKHIFKTVEQKIRVVDYDLNETAHVVNVYLYLCRTNPMRINCNGIYELRQMTNNSAVFDAEVERFRLDPNDEDYDFEHINIDGKLELKHRDVMAFRDWENDIRDKVSTDGAMSLRSETFSNACELAYGSPCEKEEKDRAEIDELQTVDEISGESQMDTVRRILDS